MLEVFYNHEDFLMKDNQLCIPISFTGEKVIRDLHSGGSGGHLGRNMNFAKVEE